jgi:phthiocerol/phenolphthiocerol synthesis type-I polyketide synthase E
MKSGVRQEVNMESAPVVQPSTSPANAADDGTVKALLRIWQEQLGIERIEPDQNFFDLGGDSSLAVRMFAEIERTFGIKLPLATLYDAPTVAELAQLLRGEGSPPGWSPLVAIQTSGSRPPLFLMHGAGGTVLMYRDLSRHLGNDQPCYGLQALGLDGSSAPLTTIEEMAAVYAHEIRKTQPAGPYYIVGYCMGGTVAFEVAQQLQQQGETVALLAMLDTMNWHKIRLNAWKRSLYAAQRLVFHAGSFLSLDFAGKRRFFQEKYEILRGRIPVWQGRLQAKFRKNASGAVSDSLVLANIWRVNDRASLAYVPKQFAGVVTDIRPKKQYWLFDKQEFKWQKLAEDGSDVIVLPVNPASMLVEPFVGHLAVALRRAMDAAMVRANRIPEEMHANKV